MVTKRQFGLVLICLFCSHLLLSQNESKPLVIGVLESFRSIVLKETRTITVYLPEDYNANDTVSYPVIYLPDGGVNEDFVHIVGLVHYNTQSWVGRLPKSIVVGIENTNRRRDFTFAVPNLDFVEKEGFKKESFPQYGGSASYIAFLETELQPYIEHKYKANKERTIIGESLAGLVTTEILLKRPGLFTNYIIISPSLWWGEEKLLKESTGLLKANLTKKVRVYIGAPAKKEDVKMYNEAKTLYKNFQPNKNIQVTFDYLFNESHATVMHQAAYNAFRKLYAKTVNLK